MKEQQKSLFLLFSVVLILGVGVLVITLNVITDKNRSSELRSQASTEMSAGSEMIPLNEVDHALVEGFPEFPVYPGAEILESLERERAVNDFLDLRAEWKSTAAVPDIANWYTEELKKTGWVVEPSEDPSNAGEQLLIISKDMYKGYLEVEVEDSDANMKEILVNLKKAAN